LTHTFYSADNFIVNTWLIVCNKVFNRKFCIQFCVCIYVHVFNMYRK
jgi:hypothetical protein